ncbi:MAG: hypothetical protein E7058_04060 [Lentisphaerae bacterium]|nr:hypothetical protein [Lentisphaerota bacterium]
MIDFTPQPFSRKAEFLLLYRRFLTEVCKRLYARKRFAGGHSRRPPPAPIMQREKLQNFYFTVSDLPGKIALYSKT